MKKIDRTAVQCRHGNKGFALLEVMLAVAVLSIALLALAALQSAMMRNSSDTRTRAIAATIAQSVIDDMRAVQVTVTETGFRAFGDIAGGSLGDGSFYGGTSTEAEEILTGNSGVAFTSVAWTVDDYWWDQTNGVFTITQPDGASDTPNYKNVVVTVTWDDESDSTDPFTVVLEDIISQSSAEDSALLVQQRDTGGAPIVGFDPTNQDSTDIDIPTLGQGGDRSKVTNKPLPDVLRNDFSTITTFSTITFDEAVDNTFQTVRREEFFILNCQCQYDASSGNAGRAPTLWDGGGFVLGDEVEVKQTGSVSGNIRGQPALCNQCCRDHHDGPESVSLYDPFRPADDYDTITGDHNHYFPDADGALVMAGFGEEYLEACRFIRLDGRLRVTHDFNLAAFSVMPQSQLDPDVGDGLEDYQEYVIAFVDAYLDGVIALGDSYPATLPDITDTSIFSDVAQFIEGTDDIDAVAYNLLPFTLLARGIYIDYLDPDLLLCLRTRRGDIDPVDSGENITDDECRFVDGLEDAAKGGFLDITPFYEINVSRLANWSWTADVIVSNEPIARRNVEDICLFDGAPEACRGFTFGPNNGPPGTVTVVMENSNIGLIDTDPVDLDESFRLAPDDPFFVKSKQANIEIRIGVPNDAIIVKGNLRLSGRVTQVNSSDVIITGGFEDYQDDTVPIGKFGGVVCTRPSSSTYRCTIPVPRERPNTGSFPLAALFDPLLLGISISNYTGSSDNNIENNQICVTPHDPTTEQTIGFLDNVSGNNTIGETTRLKFQLQDVTTFEAFDPDVIEQNVFTLNLLVKPTGGGACAVSADQGNFSVMSL